MSTRSRTAVVMAAATALAATATFSLPFSQAAGAAEAPATSAPAVAATFSEGGTPQSTVFYRGPSGQVLARRFADNVFGKAFGLGGRIVGAPTATSFWWNEGQHMTELAARGTDDALWVREHFREAPQDEYTPWVKAGGQLVAPPAVVGTRGMITYFVVGTDHAVWESHAPFAGHRQSPWKRLGGNVLPGTGPAAGSSSPNGRAVYVVGTDHQIHTRASDDGATYTPWRKVPDQEPASTHPQYTADSPALLAAEGFQGYLVFFRNQVTNRLTMLTLCCGGHDYVDLAGRITSSPGAALLREPDSTAWLGFDVGARGTDNRIWMRTYRGGTWSPWKTW